MGHPVRLELVKVCVSSFVDHYTTRGAQNKRKYFRDWFKQTVKRDCVHTRHIQVQTDVRGSITFPNPLKPAKTPAYKCIGDNREYELKKWQKFAKHQKIYVRVHIYIYIYIYMLPYPRRVELSSEWSNRVVISVYARLFIYKFNSR